MRKKYYVRLSDEERRYAREVMESADAAPRYRKRANVLRMADESVGKPMTQENIAARCGVSDVTVWNTVRDHCERGMEWTLQCHNGGGREPMTPGRERREDYEYERKGTCNVFMFTEPLAGCCHGPLNFPQFRPSKYPHPPLIPP